MALHPTTVLCRWCADEHELHDPDLVTATETECPWLTPQAGPHA